MLMNIFIVSLFALGAFALTDNCDERLMTAREVCKPSGFSGEMPGTPEELDSFCKQGTSYLECTLEVKVDCKLPRERLRDLREFISFIKRVCDTETALYKNLEENIPCLKSFVEKNDMRCLGMLSNEDSLVKFEKLLVSMGVTNFSREENCFNRVFVDTCMLATLGSNCGAKARDVAVEIFEMYITAAELGCFMEVEGKLRDVVRVMELEYLESEALEELIENE